MNPNNPLNEEGYVWIQSCPTKEQTSQRAQKTLVTKCPKTIVTACPKKGGHDAYPLSHELQIQNWNSKTWTVCSKFVPSTPILNPVLQRTYSQIHKNLQIELNYPKRVVTMSKYTCHLLLYIIIYYIYFIFIIYYFILYVFYFYYMLFYII